jgi:hypothetical protein
VVVREGLVWYGGAVSVRVRRAVARAAAAD